MPCRIKTELFDDFMKRNGMCKKNFCNLCNIKTYTLRKMYKQDLSFDVKNLFLIARAIKIDVYLMFEDVSD